MRRIIVLVAAIGAAVVVWRARAARGDRLEPAGPAEQSVPPPRWVGAVDGACPASHPVKAKVGSGIYHLPGGQFYERTRPERCYVDAAAAEADGYRAARVGSAARSSA
jgi:hypothetical protein